MREVELYIHIPFCVKKCGYCDFLSVTASKEACLRYVRDLRREIQSGLPVSAGSLSEPEPATVRSVFIGGGTPSVLPAEQIAEILEALRGRFRFTKGEDAAEVTLECNPGTLTEKKLETYRACGINRLSIGLQSADDGELKLLGRIHSWEDFLKSYALAREAGFRNINIDLISAIPGQSLHSWEKTLNRVLSLKPEHLSAYSLIIEEGTPFYERYHEDDLRRAKGEQPRFLPSEEEERQMAALTGKLLRAAGLFQYEISNYARPGYECRHNIGYWQRKEYLGFGLGASSFLRLPPQEKGEARAVRLKNPSGFAGYAHALDERRSEGFCRKIPADSFAEPLCEGAEREFLSTKDEMEETLILGLRMTEGVSEQKFAARFHRSLEEVYGGQIARLVSLGLLKRGNGRIFLTPRGMDLANPVMAEFLL